jgi:hypothetical protein
MGTGAGSGLETRNVRYRLCSARLVGVVAVGSGWWGNDDLYRHLLLQAPAARPGRLHFGRRQGGSCPQRLYCLDRRQERCMVGSTPLFVVCESASCSPQTARRELASRVGR